MIVTSTAERHGGPTSRGKPSVLQIRLSQAAWRQNDADLCREPLPFVWFIEHMKATAVEHELVGTVARRSAAKRQRRARPSILTRALSTTNGETPTPSMSKPRSAHPNCIRASTRADLKCRTWFDTVRSNELDEQRLWLPCVPGQLSRSVTLVP